MGTDTSRACITCKKVFYLGYGGYATEMERLKKFPLGDHYNCELTEHFSTDYLKLREDGHLWDDLEGIVGTDGGYIDQIFIHDYISFEHIDLTKEVVKDE